MAKKRKVGRPRKEKDRFEPWQFGRAAAIVAAYEEARKRGEKHSVAVQEAAKQVKRQKPYVNVSESEVRRILAEFRPKTGGTTVLFEEVAPSEADLERRRWITTQIPEDSRLAISGRKGQQGKTGVTYKLRLGKRTEFPRHNRKSSD